MGFRTFECGRRPGPVNRRGPPPGKKGPGWLTCLTDTLEKRTMRRYIQYITRFAVVASAGVALAAQPDLTQPVVPAAIQVPAGNIAFLMGHATGTQGYICLPTSTGSFAWSKTGSASGPQNGSRPEAILFTGNSREIITHFLSANPQETSPNPSEIGRA